MHCVPTAATAGLTPVAQRAETDERFTKQRR